MTSERGGIHMKQYQEKRPLLIVGGSARAFLGEYMAGGLILVLGRKGRSPSLKGELVRASMAGRSSHPGGMSRIGISALVPGSIR